MAHRCEASWLIDQIAAHYNTLQMKNAIAADSRLETLQFWQLDCEDNSGVLTATADSGEKPFISQEIPFSDFPLSQVNIWAGFDGTCWVLYLRSEH